MADITSPTGLASHVRAPFEGQASRGYVSLDTTVDDAIRQILINNGFTVRNTRNQNRVSWEHATSGWALELKTTAFGHFSEKIKDLAWMAAIEGKYYMPNTVHEGLTLSGVPIYEKDGYKVVVNHQKITGFSWKDATEGFGAQLREVADGNQKNKPK
jgi:hypothetical protein